MGILDTLGAAIWRHLKPLIETRLDEMQAEAVKQLDQWRADAMTMLSEALPEMAGAVAEQAVKTVFEHTQVDEATDAVAGRITDIMNRLPRLPFINVGGRR